MSGLRCGDSRSRTLDLAIKVIPLEMSGLRCGYLNFAWLFAVTMSSRSK